jgi:hypothetical protein
VRCQATAPDVAQVARQYAERHGEELAIVGMAGLDAEDAMQGFVDDYGLPFPNTVSPDGRLWARFSIPVQGAWYFLDEDGEGTPVPTDLDAAALTERLEALLAD